MCCLCCLILSVFSSTAYDCEYYNQGRNTLCFSCCTSSRRSCSNPFIYMCISVFVFLELGEGPFTLSNTEQNESACVFGANVSSGEVFPLLRTSAQPSTIFHFMITTGLYKDRASREHTQIHRNPVHQNPKQNNLDKTKMKQKYKTICRRKCNSSFFFNCISLASHFVFTRTEKLFVTSCHAFDILLCV